MKVRTIRLIALVSVVGLTLAMPVLSADKKKVERHHKDKYQSVEVARFDVQQGVNFPQDWLITMNEAIVKQLQETKKFKEIRREGESPADPNAPSLKLVGTVTEYKPGSRAKRYMVGFGAGATKVKAHIKLVDRATGEVLFEDDVDGKVVMGVIGGESLGATRGLAKEIAGKMKKEFFSS